MEPLLFGIRSISVSRFNLNGEGASCFSKKRILRVVVSIPGTNQAAKQNTPIDNNGDTDPTFNFPEQLFSVNPNGKQDVVIKLKEKGLLCGKDIAQVRLSINGLLENYDFKKGENHVSCYLAAHDGTPKGELDIKYVFRERTSYTAPPQTSSRFGNVASWIGAAATVVNALAGLFANCGGTC